MERLATLAALSLLSICTSLGQADLRLAEAGVSNSTRTRAFGSAPSLQVGTVLHISADVDNLGTIAHSNITVAVEIAGPTPVNTMVTIANLDPGEDDVTFQPITIPLLAEGLYTATFTASSDQNSSETNLANNIQVRYFSIDNDVCALDAIGVAPVGQVTVSSIGTSTFADAEDGLILLSYVDLKTGIQVEGFEALLGAGSQAGGEVHFTVLDSTDVFDQFLFGPLLESDIITVTPTHVSNGKIQAALPSGATLPPGGYFVAIELYSLGSTYPISIKDDVTHDEDPVASLIYHPGDATVYSNGNALAVRLRTGDAIVGQAEQETIDALQVHPNPVSDVLYLTSPSNALSHMARVTDALGRTLLETRTTNNRIDVSSLPPGSYILRIDDTVARFVKQ